MLQHWKTILTFVLLPFCSFGQNLKNASESQKMNLPKQTIEPSLDPRLQQAWDIIDEIKSTNPKDNVKVELRSGLLQVFANNTDAIDLNRLSTIPFVGAESYVKIYNDLGAEARFIYAQNFLFPTSPGSPNKEDAFQMTTDGGLRYRFILDNTQIEDAVAVKLLYSQTTNNFKIKNLNELYMKSYTGVILGVERSIPVTPKIGILASLDVNFIQDTKSDSTADFVKSGVGFSMRGAAHYKVNWFGIISKIGGAYWQGGMVNRLSPGSQNDFSKTSHVQTFRAVSLSLMGQF
jgi:hypothetical protein